MIRVMRMENNLLIGMMVSTRKRRQKCLRRYLPFYNGQVKICSFTPDSIDWKNKTIKGLYEENGQYKEAIFPFPNVVYNRCYRGNKRKIRRLEKAIGQGKVFNRYNRLNKWKVYKTLSKSNLQQYQPDTFLYHQINLLEMLEKYKVLFLKPCYGHLGLGIYRLELMDDGTKKIYQDSYVPRFKFTEDKLFLEKVKELVGRKKYIVQQEIVMAKMVDKFFDMRVMVQKNIEGKWMVSTCASRVAYNYSFITNINRYVLRIEDVLEHLPLKKYNILRTLITLRKISIQAVEMLDSQLSHFGELSVDFALDTNGKLWIIEVNGKPQKVIFDELKDSQRRDLIYKRPLEYASYLAQR